MARLAACLMLATSFGLSPCVSIGVRAAATSEACEARSNDTGPKLTECIQRSELWRHLEAFQKIANENPGRKGHPNRNTGTAGYRASVDYVARLMRGAGYKVVIQPYRWMRFQVQGTPEFEIDTQRSASRSDWFVARLSGSGDTTAHVQPLDAPAAEAASGCSTSDFGRFRRGNIALLQRGPCEYDTQVGNAEFAGASAVILYNEQGSANVANRKGPEDGGAFRADLTASARVPIIGVASYAFGAELSRRYFTAGAPTAHIAVTAKRKSDIDYNVIAESRFGDRNRIVVVDAHLDSIFGAGMLDNASGSATIIETALKLAHTPTRNHLRFIWFGGEEIGLLGSRYYTKNLTRGDLRRIVFDIDVDVTATPNFDVLIADPAHAHDVRRFPPDVVPDSRVGNRDFADYFRSIAIPARDARFGNDGTDSNSFSLVGVPNSGILTQQDCCKHKWEVALWGGYRGNYEGKVPGWNGGCVDQPHRWCDNLSNNDPFVMEFVSKAVAVVTLKLANDESLKHRDSSVAGSLRTN